MTSVFVGKVDMAVTKDGRRYLKGCGFIGFEDKKVEKRFHLITWN